MSSVNDYRADKVRKSDNLRGLYDHARRVARRASVPLSMTVRKVDVVNLDIPGGTSPRAHVTVFYTDSHGEIGDVGQSCFADRGIARQWGSDFARKRGGTFRDMNAS